MAGIFNRAYNQANRILNGSGLSSIVYRDKGGNLSFEDKMYAHAIRILNKETLNPSFYHSNIRAERGILDPVNLLFGTAFEDDEDESDKFYYMEAMKAAKRDSKEAEKKWNLAKAFDPDPDPNSDPDPDPKDNWRVIGRDPFKDTGYKIAQDEQGREWSELDGAAIDTTSGLKHGGKTKRKKKDKVFYADFDRKGKPTPELLNRIAISRLMEDLEWERIPKEVKRKRREEAEQWEDMKFIQNAMKEDNIEGSQMFMPNQDLYKNPIFKDVITSRKGGGGLSNIKKSININGQPHKLAWINPDEASALRAMGGSGRKVEGIPAYAHGDEDYGPGYDDPGSMQSYLDVADAADVVNPLPATGVEKAEETRYLTDDGGTTTDRSQATGLTSPVTFMNLEEADLTSEEGARLGKMYRQYIRDKIKQLREGREGEGREYEKALALEAIHAEIPGSTDPWNLEKFAKDYPAIAPLGWAVKGAGWLASLDKNPVVSQVNMGGKIYDIRMDGTMTERKDEDYGDDGPDPIKKKKLLPLPAAPSEPVEKELTGMEAFLAKRPKATPRKDSNVHLSALLDQIYGEGKGQSMLG